MPGTHYTLDRDKPSRRNPMLDHPEKACARCGVVKKNDFAYFGKKWFGDRHTYTTQDICAECKSKRLSATMSQKAETARDAAKFMANERLKAYAEAHKEAVLVTPHIERRNDFETRLEVDACPHSFTSTNGDGEKVCVQCGKEIA